MGRLLSVMPHPGLVTRMALVAVLALTARVGADSLAASELEPMELLPGSMEAAASDISASMQALGSNSPYASFYSPYSQGVQVSSSGLPYHAGSYASYPSYPGYPQYRAYLAAQHGEWVHPESPKSPLPSSKDDELAAPRQYFGPTAPSPYYPAVASYPSYPAPPYQPPYQPPAYPAYHPTAYAPPSPAPYHPAPPPYQPSPAPYQPSPAPYHPPTPAAYHPTYQPHYNSHQPPNPVHFHGSPLHHSHQTSFTAFHDRDTPSLTALAPNQPVASPHSPHDHSPLHPDHLAPHAVHQLAHQPATFPPGFQTAFPGSAHDLVAHPHHPQEPTSPAQPTFSPTPLPHLPTLPTIRHFGLHHSPSPARPHHSPSPIPHHHSPTPAPGHHPPAPAPAPPPAIHQPGPTPAGLHTFDPLSLVHQPPLSPSSPSFTAFTPQWSQQGPSHRPPPGSPSHNTLVPTSIHNLENVNNQPVGPTFQPPPEFHQGSFKLTSDQFNPVREPVAGLRPAHVSGTLAAAPHPSLQSALLPGAPLGLAHTPPAHQPTHRPPPAGNFAPAIGTLVHGFGQQPGFANLQQPPQGFGPQQEVNSGFPPPPQHSNSLRPPRPQDPHRPQGDPDSIPDRPAHNREPPGAGEPERDGALARLMQIAGKDWDAGANILQSLNKAQASFTCPAAEGHFPDPEDCSVYHQCAHGTSTRNACQSNLNWNMLTNQCDWKSNVDCRFNKNPALLQPKEPEPTQEVQTPIYPDYADYAYEDRGVYYFKK